CQQYSNFPLTF
nr:immunoglobulin light chain junction region [Macaca mulatta]MOX85418.1 immunoglobulin light chain junction region [Macaca mulatta]MOX85475.1 immunoglobulin light chain junction region [Macaca mulatta]MOX86687.1 immunoglobulin light chain junction region [Macaca mulatta]MOX87227.1 immunoglobulin light chain junction region [Macaca mulatta]